MSLQKRLTFAVLGAGGRGQLFGDWVQRHADAGQVVAVAEPNDQRRAEAAKKWSIPESMQFARWEDLLARPKLADVVINGLMDQLHAPSAVAALAKGYHMLLEKPMATTLAECIAIDEARKKSGCIVSVCHSLRYQSVYAQVKRLLDEGAIGELVSFDALEGVEPIHQSHSFVRGNWGNEGRSTFMLMAKSCHDMDIVSYLVGQPCRRVSSFGSLKFFRKAYAPQGATARCTDGCPHEATCMFSALRIYGREYAFWCKHAKLPEEQSARIEALKTSPFGRCVWQCDNDVVDHQTVSFEFDGQITGTFTMTAFHPGGRRLRLHGTTGYLEASVHPDYQIRIHRYADHAEQTITIPIDPSGHGGGDDKVMANLVHAIRTNSPSAVLTTTAESLATHKIAFAAELSRREKRVVELRELDGIDSLAMPAEIGHK